MVRVGIIGGAGYTGGEAIRILLNHPEAELVFVHSNSNAGNRLCDVHVDLLGETDMRFTGELRTDVDALLLCVGHGDARKFLEATPLPDSVRVIDLSQDFRLSASSSIGGRRFVYGLPEMNRERIRSARNIANPGCFATCLQLGMLPLAAAGLLRSDVHVTALTGSTGAGQKLAPTSHFSQRVNNLSVYKAFTHQHLNEIGESVRSLMPSFSGEIDFVPYRGFFNDTATTEIYTSKEGEVIFKKYSLMGGVDEFAAQICETLNKTTGLTVAVTDRDSVVAAAGSARRDLIGKRISTELEQIMEDRAIYRAQGSERSVYVTDTLDRCCAAIAAPIISEGDALGLVLFVENEGENHVGETEYKLAQTIASFLGRHMES